MVENIITITWHNNFFVCLYQIFVVLYDLYCNIFHCVPILSRQSGNYRHIFSLKYCIKSFVLHCINPLNKFSLNKVSKAIKNIQSLSIQFDPNKTSISNSFFLIASKTESDKLILKLADDIEWQWMDRTMPVIDHVYYANKIIINWFEIIQNVKFICFFRNST